VKKLLLASAAVAALAVGACTASELSETSPLVGDLSLLLNQAESAGLVSASTAGQISEVVTGLDSLATTTSATAASGATTEPLVVTSLEAAIKTVAADLPNNAAVQSDAMQALSLLGDVDTSSSATALQQAEAAVGTFVVDYLTMSKTVGAAYGATPSALSPSVVEDARSHIKKLAGS
jgi:hypothetical protein